VLSLDLAIDAQASVAEVDVYIGVFSARGFEVATWSNRCSEVKLPVRPGINIFRIGFQQLRLLPGHYFLGMPFFAIVAMRTGSQKPYFLKSPLVPRRQRLTPKCYLGQSSPQQPFPFWTRPAADTDAQRLVNVQYFQPESI
jgi:hypothetical protein